MAIDSSNSSFIVKSPIISCSRRTDIPAFLMEWVIERIKIGYADTVNPFNPNQKYRISLKPEDVKCWVWWSKDFGKWIEAYKNNSALFKSYKGHFFQFTINSPSKLESNVNISLEERLSQLEWLINEFGEISISYRFDPITHYKMKGSNEIINNLDKFEYIIEKIASFGLKEMIFSFAQIYSKVQTRMLARGKIPIDISVEKKKVILQKLKTICNKSHIKMKACCQPDLLNFEGIEQAHCIDAYKIEKIVGEPISKERDKGQRESCGCIKSKDIGGYRGIFKCKHNCDYCYASSSKS